MTNTAENNQPTEEMSNTNTNESNGLQALATVGSFLEADGWNPQFLEDEQAYKITFQSETGRGLAYVQVLTDIEQFLFYVMMPFKVPEELRNTIAEFITRANYGLRVGNFEMDYEDGEVRYKACIDFDGEILTEGYIKNAMYPALKTVERYAPGFLNVIYGGKSPQEVIEALEE